MPDTAIPHWTLEVLGPALDGAWDRVAGACPEAGFMQSAAWAAFKHAEGYQTRRYGLMQDDRILGGATLYAYPGASDEGLVVCPEGPILPWEDHPAARDGLRKIIAAAGEFAEECGGLGLRIEPHLRPPAPSVLRNWTRAPVDLTPVETLVLDLALDDDAFRRQMTPKGRYNAGLAKRHGISIRESSNTADIARFFALFQETSRRQGFYAEPYGFFVNLANNLFAPGMASLFFAEAAGETLGAVLAVFYGRRATYLYGGSTLMQRDAMPNYAIHMAVAHAAKQRGCVEYDLYGYDPHGLPDHPYAGISRFKRQFGGCPRAGIGARDLLFYDRVADKMLAGLSRVPAS